MNIISKIKHIPIFLFIIYFLLSNRNLLDTLLIDIGHNSILKLIFFSLVTILFFFIYFLFFLIRNTYVRVSFGFFFLTSAFVSQFFFDISGNIININDIEIALLNKGSFIDLVLNYKKKFLINFMIFLFGFCLLIYGINDLKINSKKHYYFSLVFFTALLSISLNRGGFATQGLPSQLQVLIPLPLILFSENFEYSNNKVSFNSNKKQNNVILIIDESISFEYFVKAIESGTDLENFKHLKKFYSIHNCSAQAVFALMNGIKFQKNNIILRQSLWTLAKKADYKTFYFSAQEKPGKYQYLQTLKELSLIDEKFFFSNFKNKERDKILLKKLIEVTSREDNQFIVVIKNGSHFPYFDKFDLEKYNLKEDSDYKLIYTYSILENSINFLEELLKKLKKNSDLIYLSDHGQLLNKQKLSHCNSVNPEVEEWEIPLLYFKNNQNEPIEISSNLFLYDFIIKKMGFTNEVYTNKNNKLFYGNFNKRLNKQLKFKTLK